jgi:hypothetical protein
MAMLKRLGRLFVIRTRWEAWAVTWAIALGAAERGKHYLAIYPGWLGWLFFAICMAVVFVAGAKLLDSVRPALAPVRGIKAPMRRLSRNRPKPSRRSAGSESPTWSRRH